MKRFGPFNKRFRFAIELNDSIIRFIARLSRFISPLTIIRLVIAISIATVNGHSFRLFAHIGKKVSEGVKPSLAYGNAAFPIAFVVAVLWVSASSNHPGPSVICGADSVRCVAVGGVSRDGGFVFQASAGSTVTVPQSGAKDLSFIAANATANPAGLAFRGVFTSLNDSETAKGLAG